MVTNKSYVYFELSDQPLNINCQISRSPGISKSSFFDNTQILMFFDGSK